MRYLGVDYGTKRTGVALSDADGTIAFPNEVLDGDKQTTIRALKKILSAEGAQKIIVGLPVSLQGEETKISNEVRTFAAELHRELGVPVELENEMLTTKIAGEHTERERIDAASAAIILQSYLDKKNRGANKS